MAKNNIEESQQSRDGLAIGTQGNQGGKTTAGMKGPNRKQEENEGRIPNQDRSSARNEEKNSDRKKDRS